MPPGKPSNRGWLQTLGAWLVNFDLWPPGPESRGILTSRWHNRWTCLRFYFFKNELRCWLRLRTATFFFQQNGCLDGLCVWIVCKVWLRSRGEFFMCVSWDMKQECQEMESCSSTLLLLNTWARQFDNLSIKHLDFPHWEWAQMMRIRRLLYVWWVQMTPSTKLQHANTRLWHADHLWCFVNVTCICVYVGMGVMGVIYMFFIQHLICCICIMQQTVHTCLLFSALYTVG